MSIDLNAITDDDQINKVDLAHEIERTRQLSTACDKEIWDYIKQFPAREKAMLEELKGANNAMLESWRKEISSITTQARKDFEKIQSDSVSKLVAQLNLQTAAIEKKISGLEEVARNAASVEVNRYIDAIYKRTEQMSVDLTNFKKDTSKIVENYQVETRDKMAQILGEFKKIQGKFGDVSKLLS